MKKDFAFYRKLFTSTFYLSAFTFGGGYVIIPLMRKKFVEQFHWIEETEMLDLTAIAQSAPGPIAVNASIYNFQGLSSHADRDHLLQWIDQVKDPAPQQIFVVNGDAQVTEIFVNTLREKGLPAHAPLRRSLTWPET